MDNREERQKQADAAFRSSGFGMPKIAPSPIQQEADAAASLVNAKPVAQPPTLWEQVRDSEIGRSYFWGKEDYSRRAKEIADRLQVSPDVVSIAGEESLKRWENTFQTLEMGKRDDEFAQTWSDWNDISQTERAIRVHNYSDVKQTMGVVDNVMSGIRQMDAQIKLSAMGNERMELEAQGKNTDELDAKIQNLQKYIMSQSGDGGVIHDTAGNLYMQANMALNSGKEALTGALMGAATGAAAGAAVSAPFGGVGALPGARAGFIQGARLGLQMGMFNRMNEMERGTDYLQYRSGGKYGKMSADTAAKAATAVGVANAVIEFASFRMGVKALGMGVNKIAGRATATGAQSIIRNAARSIASARSVGEATKIFAKSAGLGVASETSEEVMQQATQDIAWNVAADPSEGTRKMPVTEIISNAVDAGITAAPAILGMSAVLGTGANVRFVSKAARMLRPDYEIQKEMAVHTVGAQMLRDLEADKQASALFKKDPELYTKSVQEAADKQGLGAFFVDANALMETEDGRNILNNMVSSNIVSEQALQTAIETEGRLEVPVGVYLQEDFTEQERAAVDKASAWTQDGTTQAEMAAHWENMAASKYAQELQDDIDRMIHATDRVLSDKFSAADEADKETIRQVLMTNPLDLESARKKVRKEIEDNIEQTFSDTISVMRSNLADGGVHLIPGRDTVYDQDRMLRASSNPQWYKDFYATHKRKPRKDEFYDIMLDEEEKQVQRYYSNGVIKSEQDYEDALQQIENGRKMVEALRTIDAHKDTFDELQKEKAVSLRMYLSPDEMKVYDDVKKFMDNVGGDAQESAHQAAYLWAKRAKVFTQMMHDMGHTDFVATDYLDMHPLFTMNEYTPDAADKMAAQYLQQNKTVTFVTEEERAEFEREGERFIAVLNDDAVPNSEMIRLTAAPEILTALGYTNEDIVISKGLALNTMNAPGTSAHAHAMTSKMLAQIPAALHEPVFVLKSATRKHDSIVVFTDIRDEQDQSVIVPIRFTKNKLGYANQISSMYPRTREELFMLKQIMSDNLVYISTRKGPLWAKSTRLQLPRTLLKESLNYELKIARKKGDVKHYRGNYYFQAAWHGSHHSFGRFDTNAIGTGTGRQAHGWGLYFTQSQGAARQYRDQLVSRESVRRRKTDGSYGQYLIFENGKPIDAAAQEAINRRIAAKTLKTVANGRPEETYFLPELKQVMQQLKEGDASTNRLIHVLREQIDTIKSNNKMSITAFLRQVPTDEKARIRAIVRETKAAANNEGRRTTIADVLEGIERHAKPLISQRERELADWRALSGLKVNALTVAAPGSLYKVDIPENEVLLDENRPLNEQPETVRKAIAAYYQSRPESYMAATADDLGTDTGERFLREVVFQMQREGEEDPKKAASLLLHKFGIEGITYKEHREARCFVIFNDQAVRVLERNGQAVGEMYQDGKKVLLHSQSPRTRHVRGMTALRDGRQMLFLFRKDANFSTFVHESGHVFLEDLQQMAAQENAPEWLKKDWQTVKEWTGWKDGADNRAAHEKWARGFEAYVREGNAPSRDLKAVFRRFRRWLVGIYQNLLDLGEIPPESVRNVMDRMLATQEEIDAYTAEKALDTMQDVDTKLAARLAKLKARAAEKVEKDVEAKIHKGVEEVLEDAIESWRTARTEELRKEDIYKHEALAKQFGEDVLNKYYADAAAFKKALEDAGGPLEERLKREEQEQRKAFADELMNPESIRAQVEEYMTGELGQADLLEAETRYIARERNKLAGEYMKQLRKLDSRQQTDERTEAERLAEVLSYLRSELKGHEGARESVIDAQKQLSKIRQNERAAEQELEREQKLGKQLKENHTEDAEEHAQKLATMRQKLADMRKENAAKVQAIKKTAREEINTRLQGLRDVRDSTQGRLRLIEEQAAQTLRQAPIGESLTWKTYQRKIAYYGTLSSKALVRGDYVQAAEMKERQLYHAYLAKHAVMQEQQVDKDIRRLRENLKRMTRSQQPIRLDTQARYFVHHLMYQLGLTGTDAQAPIDGFEMSSIEELLNPDMAFGLGGDPVISPALRALFAADGRNEKTWRQMPFETWEQTVQVLQAVYTAGRRMHDGLAIVRKNGEHVSIADAANELALKLKKRYGEDNRDLRQIRNDMTRADRMGQLAGELVTQLIKPEIIMNRLDGRAVGVKIDDDSFHRFIYDPIARAANRKREMTADAKRNLSRIFERRYSRNEMRTMRQERKYQVGNRKAYTKEEILTAALNWGAAENRKRVLHTFGVDEMTMNAAFGEILTAKDWDTVEKIWEFIDGYYEERSRVLERETGVPLGKVEAVPFTINGRKFEGGYYPIVYDPQLSQKASDMDVANELAKQMSSNAVFGAGLGATKQRQAVVNRELLLSLDVLPRAVNEAILHISMREAVLDVAHLLDHAALAESLQKVIGQSQYRMLREWVRDTWREELVRESSAEQFANLLRRNSTFAVMAYRTSTALLNICNIDMVHQALGHRRTWLALLKFIRHPQRITRKVKEKSSFIAEREENLDRDLARDMKVSGKELSYVGTKGVVAKAAEGVYSAKEAVDRFGYYLITKTDLMLSLPTWQAVYEDTVRAEMERGELTAEQIDAEAIAKADEAVRRIWGSGEIQDQAKVQKGRIMKFFTPFYTFFSVVLNAQIEAGYAFKDTGNPVPLMSTLLFWLFLQSLRETLTRGVIDALTGRGPDDDDDWGEYFGKEYLKNFVGTATGGIPGVNIAATLTMNTMLGEYYQGRGSQVVALRVMDELQDLAYAVGSDKRDWIDIGRSTSRVGNRLVGFSDTLTDGFWTLLRVTCTESDATWDEAVADIIFDRKARKAK
ncbi:hypothetical protein [Negativicoccus succinicivorans]|uniref:MuF-C-terminal domain-containing protein n=1 Tax=Negativicoccus succinicivorans TaxID=620903 RepID=UPI002903F3A0|nr:hypothetical protein [Negativicoccus succinicivorans]MDU2417865.1 hypothetical protein [Negativicoccus succinicivorans]